jgi:hypothetical protein
MTPNLESAIALAAMAHQGQVDKGGAPYILHPLRVMGHMQNNEERIVAVLHDVIEDCPHYPLQMFWGMGHTAEVIKALDCLTRGRDEPYEAFIARCKGNEIARQVKIHDLADNMNLSRISWITPADIERIEKYQKAWEYLTGRKVSVSDYKYRPPKPWDWAYV